MEENRSLSELAALLKDRYREQATIKRLFYPDHPLPIEQCYLDLALIEDKNFHAQKDNQGNTKEESRDYFLHSYERIQHSQRKLTPEQLLTECRTTPKRIYIEGAAGAGKTTLSQFITYQWSQDHSAWKYYDFLFRIRLRDLTSSNYLEQKIDFIELLEKECFRFGFSDSLTENEKNSLLHYLKSKTKKVLFILDGYDELSLESNAIKILWKNLINSTYDFIITSRPGMPKADLKTQLNVAVLGFSDEQVEKYITYFFDPEHTPGAQSQDANLCLQTFRQDSNLWSLAHTPIQLELLCNVWSDDIKQTPDITLTQLYHLLYEKMLKRCEQKQLEQEKNDHVNINNIKMKNVLPKYTIYMEYLEYIAYLGMESRVIVLPEILDNEAYEAIVPSSEDSDTFYNQLEKLGFIRREGKQTEFLHLTFQEYFAARYIVRCFRVQRAPKPYKSLDVFIAKQKYHRHYEIVWWFVAGLIGEARQNLEQYIALLSSEPKGLVQEGHLCLLTRCLDEAGSFKDTCNDFEDILKQFEQCLDWHISPFNKHDPSYSLYYFDRNCLAYSTPALRKRINIVEKLFKLMQSLNIGHIKNQILHYISVYEDRKERIEVLLKFLQDEDPFVKRQAEELLEWYNYNDESYIKELLNLLETNNYYIAEILLKRVSTAV